MRILLERLSGRVSALQGALSNHVSTNYQSGYAIGYLNELGIIRTASNAISIDTGLLQISGFRVENNELFTHTFSSLPSMVIKYHAVAVVDIKLAAENSTCDFIIRPSQGLRQDNIFKFGEGVFELELARFDLAQSGITNLTIFLKPLELTIGYETAIDFTTTNIAHILKDNEDKSFAAENIKTLDIIFPTSIRHGFISGLNFKTGPSPPIVTFTNNSAFPFTAVFQGVPTTSYSPAPNKTIDTVTFCNGMNVCIDIRET